MHVKAISDIKIGKILHTRATTEESIGFFPTPIQIMTANVIVKTKTSATA